MGPRAAERGQAVNCELSELLAETPASRAAEPRLCTPTVQISSGNAGRDSGSEQSVTNLGADRCRCRDK